MDYKYINQLLERYWECQTTLEEENILRAFFSQDDIPASLLQYRNLFVYEATEPKQNTLGEDFDEKMLAIIGEGKPVKAKRISMSHKLMPLFRAAAVVAMLVTIGNAIQMSVTGDNAMGNTAATEQSVQSTSVAKNDSLKTDSPATPKSNTAEETSAITPL